MCCRPCTNSRKCWCLTLIRVLGLGLRQGSLILTSSDVAPQVAKLVAEIFAEMTFIFGDVHCDPHQVTRPRLGCCKRKYVMKAPAL